MTENTAPQPGIPWDVSVHDAQYVAPIPALLAWARH